MISYNPSHKAEPKIILILYIIQSQDTLEQMIVKLHFQQQLKRIRINFKYNNLGRNLKLHC